MRNRGFIKLSNLTLIVIYLVILAGAIVRMSGSGMGCPDWPKCFGQWIPPTEESELPEDYQEIYTEKRIEKAERFANTLESVGFTGEAEKLRQDETIREQEKPFNATKTWVEYVNRLIGFIAGNLLLLVFLVALFTNGIDRTITLLALFNVLLVGFQAWFGSIVVATNLVPWTISIHMIIALGIAAIQIYIIQRAKKEPFLRATRASGAFRLLLWVAIGVSLFQIVLGTQVRQEVDALLGEISRNDLITNLSTDFEIHRSFAILVLLVNGGIFYLNFRNQWGYNTPLLLMLIVLAEALAGIILSYFGLPKAIQPVHLMLAVIMFGAQIKLVSQVYLRR